MTQKEKIIEILSNGNQLTQAQIAEKIYGDRNYLTYVYSALQDLVKAGMVYRMGSHPALYSLNEKQASRPDPVKTAAYVSDSKGRNHRDVSSDVISNESLQETEAIVQKDEAYGKEFDLITGCLQRFPTNTDPYVVAMKIGLIDITNSTHLAQHKSKISMDELCKIITAIPDIDRRIAEGDPTVVNEIAKSNRRINLFSFASKYCCYHNYNLYHRDDYSILDTVLKETLPLYFPEITKGQIQRWQDHFQYEMYNGFITRKLDELGITIQGRKRKFDHFVWYKNRGRM